MDTLISTAGMDTLVLNLGTTPAREISVSDYFQVFPNITSDRLLKISSNSGTKINLQLLSVDGKVLQRCSSIVPFEYVNLEVAAGTYFLKLSNNYHTQTFKIVLL
ncbi:MAG: T9SS type A sorting domain-containing protein [Saprospiraceae bacterium]|nr:T9SS type A sorting domain-containing protein [Saprospiraceae bacterium]